MKILWTCAILCLVFGVVFPQNVVRNINTSPSNYTHTDVQTSTGQYAGQQYGNLCSGTTGCTTTIVAPVTKQCPFGYALDNNLCIRSEVVYRNSEKILRCNSGYNLVNGQCVRYSSSQTQVSVQYVCPTGYTLIGNLCYPTAITAPQQPQIQYPQIQQPQIQYPQIQQPQIQYPQIQQPQIQYPQIQQPQIQQPQVQCPGGYSYNGVNCAQYVPSCPTGHQFSGGMCNQLCQGQARQCIYGQTVNPPCAYQSPVNCGVFQQSNPCCGSYVPPVPPVVPVPPVAPVPPIAPVPPVVPVPPVEPIQPIPATPQCPPGLTMMGEYCIAKITEPDTQPPTETCPDGYTLYGNECRKQVVDVKRQLPELICPEGTTYTAQGCVRQTCVNATQPIHPNQPCVINPSYPSAPDGSTSTHHLTNHINNHNPVNVTTNVNANSTTHVIVHLTTADGETHVITDGDKDKIVIITPAPQVPQVPIVTPAPIVPESKKCCTIVSPRMCSAMEGGSWGCFHRRKQVCSSACDRPQMYLRPRQPIYRPPVMVVPPMRVRACRGCSYRSMHDCSGCQTARGYCPQYCSSYQCSSSQECGYMNQESYCNEYGGEFCSSEYGCLDGEYCE